VLCAHPTNLTRQWTRCQLQSRPGNEESKRDHLLFPDSPVGWFLTRLDTYQFRNKFRFVKPGQGGRRLSFQARSATPVRCHASFFDFTTKLSLSDGSMRLPWAGLETGPACFSWGRMWVHLQRIARSLGPGNATVWARSGPPAHSAIWLWRRGNGTSG
jgi:hypothetical protein